MYVTWNDCQKRLVNMSITSHSYLFLVVRTFTIYSFSNFRVYSTILLTIVILTRSVPRVVSCPYFFSNVNKSHVAEPKALLKTTSSLNHQAHTSDTEDRLKFESLGLFLPFPIKMFFSTPRLLETRQNNRHTWSGGWEGPRLSRISNKLGAQELSLLFTALWLIYLTASSLPVTILQVSSFDTITWGKIKLSWLCTIQMLWNVSCTQSAKYYLSLHFCSLENMREDVLSYDVKVDGKPWKKWSLSSIVRMRNLNWVKGVQLCGGFPGYPLSPTALHDPPLNNLHPPTDILWFPDSLPLSSPLPSLDAVCLSRHPYWGFPGLINHTSSFCF